MHYEQRLALVKHAIVDDCRKLIRNNWEKKFNMWLIMEADIEFGYSYQNKFKEQFAKYMNSDVEDMLWLLGKNLLCSINAFMRYKDEVGVDDVLDFAELFIKEQIEDFTIWSDDISMAMFEELNAEATGANKID